MYGNYLIYISKIKTVIIYFKEVFYTDVNPGLEYEFAEMLPASQVPKVAYIWEFDEFEGCSARCGTGLKTAKASCNEKTQGKVSDKFCDHATKPEPKTMECFVRDCKSKYDCC